MARARLTKRCSRPSTFVRALGVIDCFFPEGAGRLSFISLDPNHHRNMKHYILISVDPPKTGESTKQQIWNGFLNSPTIRAPRSEKIEELAPNVWLIPIRDGVPFFGHLVHELEENGLSYKVRWLAEEDV